MDIFLHQVASGIATGTVYALLALALVMIYQSTHTINFAQGEMAMLSTYIAWMAINAGWPYWGAFAGSVLFGLVFGFLTERIVLYPLRNAPVLAVVVVFIGLMVAINSIAGFLFGYDVQSFPSPFGESRPSPNAFFSYQELGAIGVAIAVVIVLYLFLKYTPVGLAMRAAALSPVSSRLSGIPVNLMLSFGWGLAAAIGSIAGMIVAPVVFLDPHMMSGVLLYAFAAALVGGIDNPAGAIVGGLLVGVIDNLAGTYLVGTELKLSVALALILIILLVRPSGLFGRRLVTRV
jgi:branched-chain amino acid transport system permease protein